MSTSDRTKEASFGTFARLLVDLHRLISRGKGDDPEADEVRDEMDDPWRHLSAGEQDLVDGLSADLYSIGVDRQPQGTIGPQDAIKLQGMIDAASWAAALDKIREQEAALPADEVAGLRGICWQGLGQNEAASVFFQEAMRINPRTAKFEIPRLCMLVRSGRIDEAVAVAQSLPADAWSKYIFTQHNP